MPIGLKDLNKSKQKAKEMQEDVIDNHYDSLLDLILYKHEQKHKDKEKKRTLRPWESHQKLKMTKVQNRIFRKHCVIEMSKLIKKRARELFTSSP